MIVDELREVLLAESDPFTDIIGQEDTKEQVRSALLAKKNIIIVGSPGIGKTTLARNVAKLLPPITVNACAYRCLPSNPICPQCRSGHTTGKKTLEGSERFVRIQGSPDLTAEDLLGDIDPVKALKFGPTSIEAFTPGKIFRANNGILFFDELNRCPEKLQNALLQVLEEGRATIGSYDIDLEAEFLLIGTMNPEDTSTEKLSDEFLDRFDLIYMKHPESQGIELQIVKTKGKNIAPYPESLLNFMVSFMRGLRSHQKLEKVPSVRASIGLYDRSQAMAKIRRHEKVAYQDLNDVVVSVLSHRIRLKPSFKYLMSNDDFVQQEFSKFSKGAQEDGDVP